jgi:hypothetical protein
VLEGLSDGDKVVLKAAEKSQSKSEKPAGDKEAAKKE